MGSNSLLNTPLLMFMNNFTAIDDAHELITLVILVFRTAIYAHENLYCYIAIYAEKLYCY